jgi:hypothetical protein
MRQTILLLRYGPPHPVKTTLKKQRKKTELTLLNEWFQLWKLLIRNHHHFVHPWNMINNGTNEGDKKELPWQPQRPLILQTFRTSLPNCRAHFSRFPITTSINGDLNHNARRTEYPAGFVTIENCAMSKQPQMQLFAG